MARLSRNSGFDIRDQPEDSYDATGQFPHLDREPETEFENTEYLDEQPFEQSRPSRRRAAVAIALALTAGATTVLFARNPAATTPAAPVQTEPAAPAPAPEVSEPADDPKPPATDRPRPVRRTEPKRKPQPRKTEDRANVPAAVPVQRRAPVASSEPAGGEFILGAR